MKKYDLIAFDMDGTLLNSAKQILPSSLQAIGDAVNAGKTVSLSTGRSLSELEIFGQQLDIVPYFICASGALVYDNIKKCILAKSVLEDKLVREIMRRAGPFDLILHLLSRKDYMQSDQFSRLEDCHMGVYRPMYEKTVTQVSDIRTYYEKHSEDIPVLKLNLYCRTAEDRDAMRKLLKGLPLELVDAEKTSLECSPLGLSKAKGLHMLCNHLQLDMKKAIAVGDADNDIEMLKAVGLSVAMGNANEHVKQAAAAIVSSCDEGGCAEAIYKYLLQQPGVIIKGNGHQGR